MLSASTRGHFFSASSLFLFFLEFYFFSQISGARIVLTDCEDSEESGENTPTEVGWEGISFLEERTQFKKTFVETESMGRFTPQDEITCFLSSGGIP